jgi:3-methyladenine DNA glycosylase AlkD
VHLIVERLRADLAARADPAAAVEMQRYMKSAMPFRGVAKPAREQLLKAAVATYPLAGSDELDAAVRELWDGAEYREERYLALSLTGHRRHLPWLAPSWVPLLRDWIVTGGWWDFTDEIASRRIGPLLRAHPDALRPVVRGWINNPDRWLRRTSVICQLQAGRPPTPRCSPRRSRPTSTTRTSSSARASAGPCASTPGPTRSGSARSSPTTPASPRSPAGRPYATSAADRCLDHDAPRDWSRASTRTPTLVLAHQLQSVCEYHSWCVSLSGRDQSPLMSVVRLPARRP